MKILFILLFCYMTNVFSAIQATVFLYEEKENDFPPANVRYLLTKKFMRIDNGHESDDYILFDREDKKIFSVNNEDQTILVINSKLWEKPDLKFPTKIFRKKLLQAPKISGQSLVDYSVKADNEVCSRYQLLPDMFKEEMNVFHEYQKILSGQQVKSLKLTPNEMKTPCFLVDQIYNDGSYYLEGVPVQEWHNRGYAKILKDFKQEEIKPDLLLLPKEYKKYSINY